MPRSFKQITRQEMRKLAPGEKLTESGITFERLRNGDGRFSVNIMVDGQRIHRVIGLESDGVTRTQAEDFIEKTRRDAREGRLSLPKGRKVALSFEAAAAQYLERLHKEGGKDLVMKEQRLRLHLTPFFGRYILPNIKPFHIERYKRDRLKEGGKPGTINRELAALSHLFTKALEWGWTDYRPAVIKRLKEDSGRIVFLTAEQCERLVEASKHDLNPQIYPFIVIGLETGMRRTEILSIRKEHVDTAKRVIYIPKAKAGAREQPITNYLAQFLDDYITSMVDDGPWLFPSPRAKSGHTFDVRKAFRRVVVAAELDPDVIVRHTLRHTAVTHLVQAGVDLPTVQRISGHKTLSMVAKYAHQSGSHIEAAMDKLESRYRHGRTG